ncbi:hypothetical protein EV643_110160 [Kribbella sp. VKM Ac-2527]|uniref:Uncharacterized protein n=1 Tax=Kribbella caucasensis TaxID=2512215 RepID=A0A4R6KDW7_9ACTN|nr:hypothetical protein [Kribbella sp. VKM Ac-2527]TDO46777.1 hypothetical protein EV643_110160 [Kribbella sp. VKM Ac-2527]
MLIYRNAWRAVCWVFGAVGVAAAVIVLPGDALLALGLLTFIAVVCAVVGYQPGDAVGSAPRLTRGGLVVIVIAATTTVVAAVGLAAILGVGIVWLALFLGLVSPAAVRWYGRRMIRSRRPQGDHDGPLVDTAQLCREWLDSYEALRQAVTPAARLRIVMERQRCLDELERRDPEGLNAWLSSNASAAGDPSRFLSDSGPESPTGS